MKILKLNFNNNNINILIIFILFIYLFNIQNVNSIYIPKCIRALKDDFGTCDFTSDVILDISNIDNTPFMFADGSSTLNFTDPEDDLLCANTSLLVDYPLDFYIRFIFQDWTIDNPIDVPLECLKKVGSYMCSSFLLFDYPNTTQYCSSICDDFYDEGICAPFLEMLAYTIDDSDLIPALPETKEECIFRSAGVGNSSCHIIPLMDNSIQLIDYYPGGLIRGYIIGFALLLVTMIGIALIGILMKYQNHY